MRGKRQNASIKRRRSGERNPLGEAGEEWDFVVSDVRVHIQPLNTAAAAALQQAEPGQVRTSTHLVLLSKGTDIEVDDRLVDASDNEFVIQRIEKWSTQIEAYVAITDLQ